MGVLAVALLLGWSLGTQAYYVPGTYPQVGGWPCARPLVLRDPGLTRLPDVLNTGVP